MATNTIKFFPPKTFDSQEIISNRPYLIRDDGVISVARPHEDKAGLPTNLYRIRGSRLLQSK